LLAKRYTVYICFFDPTMQNEDLERQLKSKTNFFVCVFGVPAEIPS